MNLVNLAEGDRIKAFVTLKDFHPEQNIIMCTRKGLVKKTPLSAFSHPRSNGIKAIKLREEDELIDARISESGDDILLATHEGKCNRFSESEIRLVRRFSQGLRGIRLRNGDYVISMTIATAQDQLENGNPNAATILPSANGYGKRSPISAIPVPSWFYGSYNSKNQ